MRLLIASCGDVAGMNIMHRLQEAAHWAHICEFQGKPVLRNGDLLLTRTETPHLYADDVDKDFSAETGHQVVEVIFLSKHKAASGIRTLTVHPIGNYRKADYGGRDGELVPSSPATMGALLRSMAKHAEGLPFKVSYEVTHHGPWLSTPSVFIEIGSGEEDWGHEGAAKALASSLLSLEPKGDMIAIGVGGGHYAPRFTELALSKRISFGHMVPGHALDGVDDDGIISMISKAAKASDTDLAYVHKKSFSGPMARRVRELVSSSGLRCIDSTDIS